MEGLQGVLGSRYEVILHDLSHVENSIVAIFGNVTGRRIGAPATNFLLECLRKYGDDAPDSVNYRTNLPDGRVLRSSTMFIRDNAGMIIGSLCINQDMTDFALAGKLMQELNLFAPSGEGAHSRERFARDISEVTESMVKDEIDAFSRPVAYMQREDKLEFVRRLEEKGIFDVRGAVEYVAECLSVTNFTIYNYLKEIRGGKR
ncbi:MAG: PAS domain-containing protein [Clostridia bacterium]|nr:PAS domain-containing protein [Clostridia bacterium]